MFGYYLLEAAFFSTKSLKGNGSRGRGGWDKLKGVEGGETIIRTYYMGKESISNKWENETYVTPLICF